MADLGGWQKACREICDSNPVFSHLLGSWKIKLQFHAFKNTLSNNAIVGTAKYMRLMDVLFRDSEFCKQTGL